MTDGQTHGHTDKNESPLYHWEIFFFFFCIYVRGKEGNSTNPTKFLPLHFVKDYDLYIILFPNMEQKP